MDLNAVKLRYSKKFLQVIVFHKDGTFQTSCDSLTDTSLWHGHNLYEKFPILSSLQDLIKLLDQAAKPISLPAVDMTIDNLQGVFDFDIYVHPENDDLRIWMIFDNTLLYTHLQEIQQERNLLRMEIEDLKSGKSIQRQ